MNAFQAEEYFKKKKKYYYTKLNHNQKRVYFEIARGYLELKEYVDVRSTSEEEITLAYRTFWWDFPELVYVDTTRCFVEHTFTGYLVKLYYLFEAGECMRKFSEFEHEVLRIAQKINAASDHPLQREMSIHAYIVKNVTYDKNAPYRGQSAYTALMQKRAVCAGISKLFKALSDQCGLDVIVVSGDLDSQGHSEGNDDDNHLWNMFLYNGQAFHVDAVNDGRKNEDKKEPMGFWFNFTDREAERTYQWNRKLVPACNSEKYSVHALNGWVADNWSDVDRIIKLQKETGAKTIMLKVKGLLADDPVIKESVATRVVRIMNCSLTYSYSENVKAFSFYIK